MNFQKLEQFLKDRGEPQFRCEQIIGALCRQGKRSFLDITTIPLSLRQALQKEIPLFSFSVVRVASAKDERAYKAVLKLNFSGGAVPLGAVPQIETVFMAPKPGEWSACVSCQAGCPMGCAFCATGKMGFKRNLTAEEICGQVLFWRQWFKGMGKIPSNLPLIKGEKGGFNEFTHIVFMGMGEPGANWEAVAESLRAFLNPKIFGFGSRGISLSTCGMPEVIKNMAKDFPQVSLAVSLHFANDKKRSKFMPVNRAFNLTVLQKSLSEYFTISRRKVFIEYIMLENINDSEGDALELASYLKSIKPSYLFLVNLIPYNSSVLGKAPEFSPSPRPVIERFRQYLRAHGIHVTLRKSLGTEISGACGQLAGELG